MKDNRGFSLIEMLVVIAIVVVLSGTSLTMVNMMSAGNMTKAARSLSTDMQDCRQRTMTQNLSYGYTFEAEITSGATNTRIYKGTSSGNTLVGGSEFTKCKMTYTDNSGTVHNINKFTVKYEPSTGAVKTFTAVGTDGATLTQSGGVAQITLSQSKKSGTATLYFVTGKVEVD